MSEDMMALQIAGSMIRDAIPKDGPLEARIRFSMRYVREHARDVLWMTNSQNEDIQFRAALAGVMLAAPEDDRAIITRSMRPLQALSAAISGIPVDFSAIDLDVLPLMKMWRETETAAPEDTRHE